MATHVRATSGRTPALRDAEHDRGLHDVTAVVSAIERPVPSVLRVTARLALPGGDANWALPNVAFRIHPDGPAYGGASRIYTVRSYDAAAAAFTSDIVLHAHASPMMRWGASLRTGDAFRLTGPRPQFTVAGGKEKRIALFLDETGIPALYAMLKQWPASTTGIGWVVTDDAPAFDELPSVPGLVLQRLGSAHVAPDGPLADQARAMAKPQEYAIWGAGERDEMRAIRQHFRARAGLDKEQVLVAGDWKRGVSNTDVDLRRRQSVEQLIAKGGTLADFDDLAIDV